jgi:hypothetical protein
MTLIDTAKIGAKGGRNSRKNQPDGGTALGQQAALARWAAYYKAHPEKLKAKQEREAKKATGRVKRGGPPKKAARKKPGRD